MDIAATVHLMIDEQARRTKALLPLRGAARYQLLVNGRGVAVFAGADLPRAVSMAPGSYRLRVSSKQGWAISNVVDVDMRPGERVWLSLDVDERARPSRFVCPGGVVATCLLVLTHIRTPLETPTARREDLARAVRGSVLRTSSAAG